MQRGTGSGRRQGSDPAEAAGWVDEGGAFSAEVADAALLGAYDAAGFPADAMRGPPFWLLREASNLRCLQTHGSEQPPLFTCCHVLGYRVKVSAKGLILRRPPLPNGRCE